MAFPAQQDFLERKPSLKTPYQIIDAKKHGNRLTDEDIRYFIGSYMSNDISDAQMSALLMAICFNGMDASECTSLTLAMAESGEQLDMSSFPSLMDKHSTGGVGDKTTFLVGHSRVHGSSVS